MKEITIDCTNITDVKAMHKALAEALSFPQWYGNNYAALHDCLTDIGEDTTLTLLHFDRTDHFNKTFRVVFNDSEAENPNLFVTIA
jgi:RNAse (barnase) inhibitor barstar